MLNNNGHLFKVLPNDTLEIKKEPAGGGGVVIRIMLKSRGTAALNLKKIRLLPTVVIILFPTKTEVDAY